MKRTFQKVVIGLLLAGATMLFSGCRSGLTTSLVWRIGVYHPAQVPRLKLATRPGINDVLVQYDECFAHSGTVRPRAYWLFEYAAKDTNAVRRPKPAFVSCAGHSNLCCIPQVKISEPIPTNGFCARLSTNEISFTLWRDSTEVGEYILPVYSNAPPATWGRVLLTPVTVTTDAAIVTAAISALILVTCPPIFWPGGG